MEQAGQFGDRFGMATSIFGGITIVFLLYTIRLQRKEIALNRETIELSRKEMELSTKAIENSTIELQNQLTLQKNQRFDNTFFNILKLNLEIIAELNPSQLSNVIEELYLVGRTSTLRDVMLQEYNSRVSENIREQYVPLANSMAYLINWICKEKKVDGEGREKYLPLLFAQLRKNEKIFLFYYFHIIYEGNIEHQAIDGYLIQFPIDSKLRNAINTFSTWK